jgi:hypothetical protein
MERVRWHTSSRLWRCCETKGEVREHWAGPQFRVLHNACSLTHASAPTSCLTCPNSFANRDIHQRFLQFQHAIYEHASLRPTTSASEQRRCAPNTSTSKHAKARFRQWHRMGIRPAKQLCRWSCSWRFRGRGGCWCCAGSRARTRT